MKFSGYNLNAELLQALTKLNYIEPTRIQESTLSKSLKGISIIAKSETGSGKTHAYLIPAINNLDLSLNKVQAIIVEPTLELCLQCQKFITDIANITNTFKVLLLASSTLTNDKHDKIKVERPTIVITTPGRLKDVVFTNKTLDVSSIKTMVLDESDMLLESDESQDMINLVDKINPKQKLIFTATMKEHQIASLKKLFSINEMIDVDKKSYSSKNVSHHFVDIKHRDVCESLEIFLETEHPYFTMVFASKKAEINRIYKRLCEKEIKCALLTSDISLRERKNILRRINDGEFELVLCSDLASRGLDLEKVSHVISLDIPSNLDYYYHRAGRCGRYKEHGDSYIFYNDELNKKIKYNLESKIKFDYFILRQEGLKVDKKRIPQPKKKNEKLEAEIKKELAKVRTSKVKPNYKKKMKRAIAKATKMHKRKIVMENIRNKRKAMAFKGDIDKL